MAAEAPSVWRGVASPQVSASLPYLIHPDSAKKTLYNHGLSPFGLHFRISQDPGFDSR